MEEEDTAVALLLRYSSQHLALRDFTNCRLQALSAQRSSPNHPGPAQILAIADVLLAAGRRLRNGHRDWYSILQVQKTISTDETQLRTQFRKLLNLLNPTRNKFPLCEEALGFVADAWRVLSDPVSKAQYDKEAMPTFYTVCPYCYYMYEHELIYQGLRLLCQTCRRDFRAIPVPPPLPEAVEVVETEGGGKEERYRVQYDGRFPSQHLPTNKDKGDSFHNSNDNVVVISSDEEDEAKVEEKEAEKSTEIPKKRNIKRIPWNAKKISGRGVRINTFRSTGDFAAASSGSEKMDGVVSGSENGISKEGDLHVEFDGNEPYISL